ncbi:MAG: protein kinase domain-containing protein [Blastocatellia bacterium]
MTPDRWRRIEQLYHEALAHAPADRAAFLAEACAGDADLGREVESLLASHDSAAGFIDSPPEDVVAGMIAEGQACSILGRTLGHYQIQSLLGAGGMGEVYRARDLRLDRDVAVKILPEHLADHPDALSRFEREAKAVAALSHPNILSIFDFGTEDGASYAVMELLEGETLRERVNRGPLAWREAVEIGIAIAEGLAAAHDKGIIHRDLKPENLFLTSTGGVKILDFGIARVKHAISPDAETMTGAATRPGTIIGTMGYMSPEQVRGEQADAPSDIFSLGCVLYEMVSGQRPFVRTTTAEMIAAILDAEPPQLTQTGRKIPAELERVIRHCLEKRPGERYQSARDLAFDLKAMLSGRSITAPARGRRRTPVAAWLGAAAAVALLVIAAWLFWGSWREQAIDSLAVLPLINASGDVNAEYLSDGITESIINNMSQLPSLRVMARSTVFSYKGKDVDPRQVGRELDVKAVFTGRVLQRGDTLSIQADLVNAADGSQLWGERYDRKLADLLAIQEEIAKQISGKLRLRLTGAERKRLAKHHTDSIEAHQLYLKGRYYWNKVDEKSLKTSIELFHQAIDLDPNYALPYVGLADSYYFLSNIYLPPKEAMPRSRAAAMKALELDDSVGEAHAALAAVKTFYDWDWAEGENAFKRAIELNPGYAAVHNTYGIYLIYMKRFEESQAEMNRARELDPLSPFVHIGTVWPVLFARKYDHAIEQLHKIIALNPDFAHAHLNLGWAYAHKGMNDEAIAAFNKAHSLDNYWHPVAALGYVYGVAGRKDEARKTLAELQERAKREHISEYGLAMIYAGLGEKDQAIAELQKAYDARDEYMPYLNIDPFFDSLRSDQRFTNILRRLKLAP